jgi:TonB family protein
MTISDFVIGISLLFATQDLALEKRAVAAVQQMAVSQLDSQLPERSFSSWFNQVVGAQAGVNWQLTDCGEQNGSAADRGRDLPYCVEVVAITQNQRKAFVNILVGSSQRGIVGQPSLYFAVVENKGEFYTAKRLSELPDLLTKPLKPKPKPVVLPDVKLKKRPSPVLWIVGFVPIKVEAMPLLTAETPPPPPSGKSGAKALFAELGEVVTKVTPEYPITARQVAISGEVKVRIVVSEDGRVLEAKAVSGSALFWRSAELAASKWIFKPAMANGKPVKAEGTISFQFKR